MPKKEGIQKLFDDIAPEYDRLNHIMSFDIDKMWRRRAVRRIVEGDLSVRGLDTDSPVRGMDADSPMRGMDADSPIRVLDADSPVRVLDVASGTGDFAIAIAQKASAGSTVCGLDLSEGMLQVGREKIAALGLSDRISMVQGDCEALPFEDESFDRVSVAFGIRNFEHLELGLKEMCRVLRKGGRLVILELSYPDNAFLNWCFRIYSTKFLPLIGGRISGNKGAYEYLPASILKFPKQDVILPLLLKAGFATAEHKAFTFGTCRMYVAVK